MEVTAKLMYLRASPRKLKLIADTVRGRKVSDSLSQLQVRPQASALAVAKLLRSARANAKANQKFEGELWVKSIEVGQGPVLKRWRPAAHGAAHPIRRPMAHIKVVLSDLKPVAKRVKE